MNVTAEMIAEMVAMHQTHGLKAIGTRFGISAMTVGRYLYRYGGVTPHTFGRYATPRLNEDATPETWRCTRCRRTQAEGAQTRIAKDRSRESWCRSCWAEYHRQRYHERKADPAFREQERQRAAQGRAKGVVE